MVTINLGVLFVLIGEKGVVVGMVADKKPEQLVTFSHVLKCMDHDFILLLFHMIFLFYLFVTG